MPRAQVGRRTGPTVERVEPAGAPLDRAVEVYRAHGGLVTGEEAALQMRRSGTGSQPLSHLARLIVERRLLCFERHGLHLLPLAQFETDWPRLKPAVQRVLDELRDVFDATELALWFAEPNAWLGDARPIDRIDAVDALHAAARADRYIATGD